MKNDKLRGLRNTFNIGQRELAEYLSVSISTYSQKETGIRSFTQPEMYKIYQYFKKFKEDITLDEIFLPLIVTGCEQKEEPA